MRKKQFGDDRNPQANIADSTPQVSSGMHPFTKEQIEQICKILSSQNLDNSNSSCSMAQKGNYHIASCLNTDSNTSWIIDSGASDHMTGSSELFSSYSPCAGNQKVKIADGSFSAIAGK